MTVQVCFSIPVFSLVPFLIICLYMHLPTFPFLHFIPVSVFRKLFCGEKPQRSWGKETSTSVMNRLSEPSLLLQSNQRCEGDAINWTYVQTHPNSSLLNSQRFERCPTLPLDWEMSLYMNTHNIPLPSGIPPHITASGMRLLYRHHSSPRTETHSHTDTRVCWMQSAVQIKLIEVRTEKQPIWSRCLKLKHTQAHTSEAIQS